MCMRNFSRYVQKLEKSRDENLVHTSCSTCPSWAIMIIILSSSASGSLGSCGSDENFPGALRSTAPLRRPKWMAAVHVHVRNDKIPKCSNDYEPLICVTVVRFRLAQCSADAVTVLLHIVASLAVKRSCACRCPLTPKKLFQSDSKSLVSKLRLDLIYIIISFICPVVVVQRLAGNEAGLVAPSSSRQWPVQARALCGACGGLAQTNRGALWLKLLVMAESPMWHPGSVPNPVECCCPVMPRTLCTGLLASMDFGPVERADLEQQTKTNRAYR